MFVRNIGIGVSHADLSDNFDYVVDSILNDMIRFNRDKYQNVYCLVISQIDVLRVLGVNIDYEFDSSLRKFVSLSVTNLMFSIDDLMGVKA